MTVFRYDRLGVLDADRVERTPQGGIRAPGRFTRVGVLKYDLPGGGTRREYRPPEEVFAPASLATLVDAPVTHLHPPEGKVTGENYARLAKGHVRPDVAPEANEFVAGTVVVQDATVVSLVDSRGLEEFSAGYQCSLDPTPGITPEGEPYDVVQRNIKYNHVALLPRGQGRAGPEVSLRLDSNGHQVMPLPTENTMELTPEELAALKQLAAVAPALVKLASSTGAPAPAPAPAATTTDTTGGEQTPAATQAPAPVLEEKKDSKVAPVAAPAPAPAPAAKVPTPEENERFVTDSIEIRDQARVVLGKEYSFRDKTNREIMSDVITRVDSKYDLKGKSDDAVRAVFDVMLARHAERADSKTELEKVQLATRQDSTGGTESAAHSTHRLLGKHAQTVHSAK